MKLHIQRKDGNLHVMHRIEVGSRFSQNPLRTIKIVKDTPADYQNILRWIDAVGHTLEEE